MKRSFLIWSMILVLAFSLCACGGDESAGIPSRETRRLTGTYNWQDVECILFDKDNTFEISTRASSPRRRQKLRKSSSRLSRRLKSWT